MLSRAQVLALAWPVVLAQAATALTGIVDTALMGRFGDRYALAAVAVAAVSFSFIYWGFGFLRMATTGLSAQAMGAGEAAEARAVLLRALAMGAALGVGLLLAFPLIRWIALTIFQVEPAVQSLAAGYLDARIWGAPAALMGYAVNGWLLGMGRTRALLAFQVVLNGANAVLDYTFVAGFDWGPAGIGAGTAIAEWIALGFGLLAVRDGLSAPAPLWDRSKLLALVQANRDIMIRTLALLGAFAWFVRAGARNGTAELAGNEVLMQFIAVAAFILDAFAFVAEKEIGEAVGSQDRRRFRRAMRLTTELALVFGACISAIFLLAGGPIIHLFIADEAARQAALTFLPFCAAVPLLGVPAFQLDGAFLGATAGRPLRTAAVAATLLYIGTDLLLAGYGNTGVWTAFLLLYVYRALGLALYFPALLRGIGPPRAHAAT